MAFEHESPMEFVKKVLTMKWGFEFENSEEDEDIEDKENEDVEPNPFDSISDDGKNFITELIKTKPSERLDAGGAIDHAWLLKTKTNHFKYVQTPQTSQTPHATHTSQPLQSS